MFNGQQITLKPGQLIASRDGISRVTGVSPATVDRVLKQFASCSKNVDEVGHQSEQQIEQLITRSGRLITVLNWGTHQESEPLDEPQGGHGNEQPIQGSKSPMTKGRRVND